MASKDRNKRLAAQHRYYQKHKEKIRKRAKEYRAENVEKFKEWNRKWRLNKKMKYPTLDKDHDLKYKTQASERELKRKYGLTKKDVQKMQASQENHCLICQECFTKTPCVDHDHKTGKIRGLLCGRCNRVLGNIEENVILLRNMILYLEVNECSN